MRIVEKCRTVYEVDDKEFTQLRDAQAYVAHNDLEKWAESVSLCSGGEWSRDMVLNAMREDAVSLSRILGKIKGG